MDKFLFIYLTVLFQVIFASMGNSCFAGNDSLWINQRANLVHQLSENGISDQRVLDAMNIVPRHEFVPSHWNQFSYEDRPLPIGNQQTISQPFIVAYMCQEAHLKPTDKVLEIGTGSGYHAAVVSLLCSEVKSIEIIEELGMRAKHKLEMLRYENIEVKIGDGYEGWPDEAPFDVILLTAAPGKIPSPLIDQLKVGGRMIAPVGNRNQNLILYEKTEQGVISETLIPVRFVPMTGKALENE